MSSIPWQPNFQINSKTAAIPGTEYDNLSPEELATAINDSYRLKTGRQGRVQYNPPPEPKRVVDLDAIFGGKQ